MGLIVEAIWIFLQSKKIPLEDFDRVDRFETLILFYPEALITSTGDFLTFCDHVIV
jgi:hypothetical protein